MSESRLQFNESILLVNYEDIETIKVWNQIWDEIPQKTFNNIYININYYTNLGIKNHFICLDFYKITLKQLL